MSANVHSGSLKMSVHNKKKPNSVFAFVGEVKQELKKVAWTTQDKLISYTKVSLGAIFVFGFMIYLMDLGIFKILDSVASLVKWIGG